LRDFISIQALKSDDNEATCAGFIRRPWSIKIVLESCANALNEQAGRPAPYIQKPFDAQYAIGIGNRRQLVCEAVNILDVANLDNKTREIIMIMFFLSVMMGVAIIKIVFDARG
jgi:hypothetical protein